jgi:hypothetical protein
LSFVEEPVAAPVPLELFELTRLFIEPSVVLLVLFVPGPLFIPVVDEPLPLAPPDVPAFPAEAPDDPPADPPPPAPPPPCANANVEPSAITDASASVVTFMLFSLGLVEPRATTLVI